MLSIFGKSQSPFCDGHSRREFLRIGALGLGGLALPDILRAEAKSNIRDSHKAVIMVFLSGGPPHQDMVDLKPDAPAEIRGEFKPINTNVTGKSFAKYFALADKLTKGNVWFFAKLTEELNITKALTVVEIQAGKLEIGAE